MYSSISLSSLLVPHNGCKEVYALWYCVQTVPWFFQCNFHPMIHAVDWFQTWRKWSNLGINAVLGKNIQWSRQYSLISVIDKERQRFTFKRNNAVVECTVTVHPVMFLAGICVLQSTNSWKIKVLMFWIFQFQDPSFMDWIHTLLHFMVVICVWFLESLIVCFIGETPWELKRSLTFDKKNWDSVRHLKIQTYWNGERPSDKKLNTAAT
jgi:hypothetical protein